MTIEQLAARFAEIGMAQKEAIFNLQNARYNRLFDLMVDIEQELKSRTGDQRRALLQLFRHPNIQVRLNAARATLAVDRQAARQALQVIADPRQFPQAGDAGMSLHNLDEGVFKPT